MLADIYALEVRTADGHATDLTICRNQVMLIVNVASRCVCTPQYAGLEALHRRYHNLGLVVLGFPCNQFARQEPGTDPDIQAFCATHYQVTFPVFAKVDVYGPDAHPLFRLLTSAARGWFGSRRIKWNFTKFLVDRRGHVIGRFAPSTRPEALIAPIEHALSISPADGGLPK